MAASMLEIGIVIILVAAVLIVGVSYIMAFRHQQTVNKQVTTRGMNGLEGATLNLSCPPGQVISFDSYNSVISRGALFCSASDAGENANPPATTNDGFFQFKTGQNNKFFNPSTTLNLTEDNSPLTLKNCKGKNSCSFTIPIKSDADVAKVPALNKCPGKIAFVGTYDCVPPT